MRNARIAPHPLLMVYEVAGGAPMPEPLSEWSSLAVGPLAERALDGLLAELAMPAEVRANVVRRARGNPSVAVESARLLGAATSGLGDLDRATDPLTGAFEAVLPPASGDGLLTTADLPPAMLAIPRLQAFCGRGTTDGSARAYEAVVHLLALLPRPCSPRLLERAWTAAGGGELADLVAAVDAASVEGIAQRTPAGSLEFAGAPMADAADTLVDEDPALDALRTICAGVLAEDPSPANLRAAAALRVRASDPRGALGHLVDAATRLGRTDANGAAEVWEEAEAIADAAGLAAADPLRLDVRLGMASTSRNLGHIDRAEALLDGIEPDPLAPCSRARYFELVATLRAVRTDVEGAQGAAADARRLYQEVGDAAGAARSRMLAADALNRAGQRQAAVEEFAGASREAADAGDGRTDLWAHWLHGRCLRGLGRLEEAERQLQVALVRGEELGVGEIQGGALRELGNLEIRRGDPAAAADYLRRSVQRLEAAGLRGEAAVTRISLGEVARARGDLTEARNEYSAASSVARALGLTSELIVALLNLGIVELAMGRGRRVSRRLEEAERLLGPGSVHGLRLSADVLRVASRADEGAWDAVEDALEPLLDRDSLPPDPDLLFLLEHAATKAAAGNQAALAADAWELCLDLADALGDAAATARLQAAMAG